MFTGPRRFVDRAGERFAQFKRAAQDYPKVVPPDLAKLLYRKPFNVSRRYGTQTISTLLSFIETLQLRENALVVDAGAGAGWVSEFLLGFGYRVIAIEPSPAMIETARDRVRLFAGKHRMDVTTRIRFIETTLEELEVTPDLAGTADAVVFSEAFHHVIDENRAASQVFTLLRPGGQLAIFGESRWLPGNPQQTAEWNEEMRQYGTLESPLTREYMDHVLKGAGFTNIRFFHAVNCLVPVEHEACAARDLATDGSAEYLNNVIAERPDPERPGISDAPALTSAAIAVGDEVRHEDGAIGFTVRLTNTGRTAWPASRFARGWVAVALFGVGGNGRPAEVANRVPLPATIAPGESVSLACRFVVQTDLRPPFTVRLVANEAFWFEESAILAGD